MYIVGSVSIWSWQVKTFVTRKVRFSAKIGQKSIFCSKMVHDTEFLIKKFESTDSFTLEMTSLEL